MLPLLTLLRLLLALPPTLQLWSPLLLLRLPLHSKLSLLTRLLLLLALPLTLQLLSPLLLLPLALSPPLPPLPFLLQVVKALQALKVVQVQAVQLVCVGSSTACGTVQMFGVSQERLR